MQKDGTWEVLWSDLEFVQRMKERGAGLLPARLRGKKKPKREGSSCDFDEEEEAAAAVDGWR